MMTQPRLPFQYKTDKKASALTGFAGLPLYLELAAKSGLIQSIQDTLRTKVRGWCDVEMLLSLMLINVSGGDCITDIERLEQDAGLRALLLRWTTHAMTRKDKRAYERRWHKNSERALPSHSAIHRYLRMFHSPKEEKKRIPGKAFIPAPNKALQSLSVLNTSLIECLQRQSPMTQATLDQDATLIPTQKRTAYYSYKKFKAYQPFNTYWAEHGALLHSEFRDGHVPAGYQQLRLLKEALALLPAEVTTVYLRSDSAGYQAELLEYCAEGGIPHVDVIGFAIASRVSAGFKAAVNELTAENWQPLYKTIGKDERIALGQEWAEVCFVPGWAAKRKTQVRYRYLAIREAMAPERSAEMTEAQASALPFQTLQTQGVRYKLFGVVTNRYEMDGSALIEWHRERCGKSEEVHTIQKAGLAGGQLPSGLFGVNAAWWQVMILSFNLNRLMQRAALPKAFRSTRMKGLRFHVIQLPGWVVKHARQCYLRVSPSACELYHFIRGRIARLMVVDVTGLPAPP